MTTPPDLDSLDLRSVTAEEYAVFEARTRQEYADEIQQNFGVSGKAARDKADTDMAKYLPDGIDTVDHHVLAITAGGELVGNLWIGLNRKVDGVEAFGYDFWVRPELRDAGIGRRAMELASSFARELGANRLALNVFGDNERAVHLYRSFGFRVGSINMFLPLD